MPWMNVRLADGRHSMSDETSRGEEDTGRKIKEIIDDQKRKAPKKPVLDVERDAINLLWRMALI